MGHSLCCTGMQCFALMRDITSPLIALLVRARKVSLYDNAALKRRPIFDKYPPWKAKSLPDAFEGPFTSGLAAVVAFLCSFLQSAGTSNAPFHMPCLACWAASSSGT